MRNIIVLITVLTFNLSISQVSDESYFGFDIGLGKIEESQLGLISGNIAILFDVNEDFIIGPKIVGNYYFIENVDGGSDNYQVLSGQLATKYYFLEFIYAGADLGYAYGLDSDEFSGFTYNLNLGYSFEKFNLQGSYTSIVADNVNFNTYNLGVQIKF